MIFLKIYEAEANKWFDWFHKNIYKTEEEGNIAHSFDLSALVV